jgi:hypothetical protein
MHRGSNPNPFVLNSGGLPREATTGNRRYQQRREQGNPITHTFEIDIGYFHCQEHRFFYPYFNYEVVQIQTTDRNASMPSDTFYILNFPIDQLSEHLVEKATQLNPRRIALCNPLSSELFNSNYNHILEMTLKILCNIDSLTKITLCVDILDYKLFSILKNQSHLREVEILQPSSTFPDGLAGIGAVLNEGVNLLRQVVDFKVPLEIVNSYPATVDYLTPIP